MIEHAAAVAAVVPDASAWLVSAFGWTARTGLEACGIAVLVLLAQWLLGDRISAGWRCNLWLLVVARLVLPAVPSRFSPFNAVPLPRSDARLSTIVAAAPKVSSPLTISQTPPPGVPAATSIAHGESPVPIAADASEPTRAPLPPVETELDPFESAGEPLVAVATTTVAPPPGDEASVEYVASPSGLPLEAPGTVLSVAAPHVKIDQVPQRDEPRATTPSTPPDQSFDWRIALAWIWLAGVAVSFLRLAIDVARLSRKLGRMAALRDPGVLAVLGDAARTVGVQRVPQILVASDDCAPALVGVWRPRLMLSRAVLSSLSVGELRLVVLHELVHLKRRDVLANWVLAVVVALHWFNPLVYLALRRMRADRELACDERVLQLSAASLASSADGSAEPPQLRYGQTIVNVLHVLSRRAGRSPAVTAVGVLDGKNFLRRRIIMIARLERSAGAGASRRRGLPLLGCVASVLVGAVALTGPVRGQEEPVAPPTAENASPVTAAPAGLPAPIAESVPVAGSAAPVAPSAGNIAPVPPVATAPELPPAAGLPGAPAAAPAPPLTPGLAPPPPVALPPVAPPTPLPGVAPIAPGGLLPPPTVELPPTTEPPVPVLPPDVQAAQPAPPRLPGRPPAPAAPIAGAKVGGGGYFIAASAEPMTPDPDPSTIAALEADLSAAQAKLEVSKLTADYKAAEASRGEQLAKNAQISTQEYEKLKVEAKISIMQVQVAEADVRRAEAMLQASKRRPREAANYGSGKAGPAGRVGTAARPAPVPSPTQVATTVEEPLQPPPTTRGGARTTARVETPADRDADERATEQLRKPVSISFDGMPLSDALDNIADNTGVSVFADWGRLSEVGVEQDNKVSVKLRDPLPAEQVLGLVLRAAGGDRLGYAVDRGVIVIDSVEGIRRTVVTRAYDVADIRDKDGDIPTAVRESVNVTNVRMFGDKLIVSADEPTHREMAKFLEMVRSSGGGSKKSASEKAGRVPSSSADDAASYEAVEQRLSARRLWEKKYAPRVVLGDDGHPLNLESLKKEFEAEVTKRSGSSSGSDSAGTGGAAAQQ